MATAACSTDDFVRLWKEFKGNAEQLAKHLGVATRNVYDRRKRIEANRGISLSNTAEHHAARHHVECKDGVVIVFSDAHFAPGVDTTAYRALLVFIKALEPKIIINNGDSFNGSSISRWPRIGWENQPTVLQELRACEDHLSRIEALSKADLIWPLGNHDARYETCLAGSGAAAYEGVKGFTLKDHFPAWIPCWSCWINEDVVVKHRLRAGIHATHNNSLWSGKSTVTGHLHSLQVRPFTTYDKTIFGVDCGCVADPYAEVFTGYTEDNPVNWRSGFVVLTFDAGRLLWPEVVRTIDAEHIDFRGKVYRV